MNTRQINIKRPTCATQAQKKFVEAPVTDWFMWFACKRKGREMETGKRTHRVIIQVVPWRPKLISHHTQSFRVHQQLMTETSQMVFWWKPCWFHSIFSSKPPWRSGLNAGTFWGKTLSIMVGGGAYSSTADCQQRTEERNTIVTNNICTFRKNK